MNSEDELRAELDAALHHDSSDGYSTPDGRKGSKNPVLTNNGIVTSAISKSTDTDDELVHRAQVKLQRITSDALPPPMSPNVSNDQKPPEQQENRLFFTEEDFEQYSVTRGKFERLWKKNANKPAKPIVASVAVPMVEDSAVASAEQKPASASPPALAQRAKTDLLSASSSSGILSATTTVTVLRPKIPGVQAALDSPPPVPASYQAMSTSSLVTTSPSSDVTAELFAVFGRYSSLTMEEHSLFLDLQRLVRQKPSTPLTPTQLNTYAELQARVQREQEEYHRAVTTQVLLNKAVYAQLALDIDSQVENLLAMRRSRVRRYPQLYEFHGLMDLSSVKSASNDPVLKHQATVLQIGRVLPLEIPAPATEIPLRPSPFASLAPPQLTNTTWIKKEMPTAANDPFVMELVKKHRIDVVLTSSVLSTLIDNHFPQLAEGWQIPVVVREVEDELVPSASAPPSSSSSTPAPAAPLPPSSDTAPTPSASNKRAVIFLEKPLLKRRITAREKNELFYKTAFESLMAKPTQESHMKWTRPITSELTSSPQAAAAADALLDQLRT